MIPQSARRRRRVSPIYIAVAVAVVILLLSLLWWPSSADKKKNLNAQTNEAIANAENRNIPPSSENTNKEEPTTYFEDADRGFSVTYPQSWAREFTKNDDPEYPIVNFAFRTTEGSGVTLIILPVSMGGIVRESVSIVSEREETINGLRATRIDARSAKDGSSVALTFFEQNDTLYVLNGPADLVDQLGDTFTFSQ
jgi:hypothetical protein